MINLVSKVTLPLLSDLIEANMGLHYPEERWSDLERAMTKAAPGFGFDDIESCAQWLLSIPLEQAHIDKLAEHLTVGESHFFRDTKLFKALEERIFPEIIESRRRAGKYLRIWSAGCATGEEPYTIAISLSKVLPDIGKWRIDILGTDINKSSLEKAEKGSFTEWSFRGLPEWMKREYFEKGPDGHYQIVPRVKRFVTFSRHNLATDQYPPESAVQSDLDLIFCRNVIMYFSPDRMRSVISNLCGCLADDGWLVVAAAEADQVRDPSLVPAGLPGVVMYRKNEPPPPNENESLLKSRMLYPERLANGDSWDSMYEPLPILHEYEAELRDCFDTTAVEQEVTHQTERHILRPELSQDFRKVEVQRQPVEMDPIRSDLEHSEPSAPNQHIGYESSDPVSVARAYGDRGDLTQALEWCEKAIAEEKLNPSYHYLHGTILNDLGRIEDAVVSMKKALFLAPEMAVAHFALGNLTRRLGKHKESAKHFEAVLAVLDDLPKDGIVEESEGMTAGRLAEIVHAMASRETPA
jgi:chemotaxis protein methyltransferase CheR